MIDFIRMVRSQLFGLNVTYVQGLNILDQRCVPFSESPILTFFRECSKQTPTSMYIGPMGLDNADALTKGIFNHPDIPCIRSGVGSFRMEFYDIGIYPDPCTFFFPEINQTFWNQALGESLYEIERSIEIESILFCLGSQQPVLQRKPVAFSDEEHWVVQVCREYDAIVGGGGADCPLTLHSASPALPRAYHIALEEAVSVVEKNDWFQINRRNLVWNGLAGRMELPHEITQRTTLDIAQ